MTEKAKTVAGINLDLSVAPDDPGEAQNYYELHGRLLRLSSALEARGLTVEEFASWDADVKTLLRPDELPRFGKPLRPHIPLSSDTIQHARHFHLAKILWARKGIEKLMTDTGF